MYSFSLMKAPSGQHPQPSQVAADLSQGSSGAYPANTKQQYMTGNSGFQLSQNANLASKNGVNASTQMANWKSSDTFLLASHYKDQFLLNMLLNQPPYSSIHLQNENLPGSTTCTSKSAPIQNSHQYLTNQGLHSSAITNSTYTNSTCGRQNTLMLGKQQVSFNGAHTNWNKDALHLQQNRAQQIMQPMENPGVTRTIPSYNPTPSLPDKQLVNATPSSAVCIGQTQAAPSQKYSESFAQCGYSQNFPQSYGMTTSQSSRNNSVATHATFSNPQVKNASNIDQINPHPSTKCNPSYNNFGAFRKIESLNQYVNNSFCIKSAKHTLNHEAASGKMIRQNMHAGSTSQASNSNPPPYESRCYTGMSRMSNPNTQAVKILRSESYRLNASQSLPPHYGQHFTQGAMSRAQQAVSAPFQQNMLTNDLSINTAVNGDGTGQVVPSNETLSERCPVKTQSNEAQGCKRALAQRNDPQAIAVSHLNSNGMPSPFKQNDSVSSMSGHTGIRAIAVVPPLSQEECYSPASSEPCKSVNDAEEISLDEAIDGDNTCSREESNRNQVNNEKATSIDETVILDLEPANLAQTSKLDTHESIVERVQEVSVSQTDSVIQTEKAATQSPPFNELPLLPTKSWTTEALTKLVLEMEKAQPKPKHTSEDSNIVKILISMWSKNIAALIRSYNNSLQMDFCSDVENFCNTHIKEGTVVLTQVSPDFKDQLKRYNIIEDGKVYSEPPYKSLWLNVNDQLDDIDKEFGFPFALKRHLFVDKTESQGHDFQTLENVPANEAVNKVLSPTESVEMTQKSTTPLNPPSSQHESPGKSTCDLKYSFKIKVLPPEEAKVIYEQIQQKQYSIDCEKETVVSDFGKQDVDIDPMLNKPKVKKSSDDQLEEICCLVRFIEMNSGLGKPSHCQCKVKQNANKDTIKTLKPHPDHFPDDREDVNYQTVNPSDKKLNINVNQIIDLTDDSDDQLFSFFHKESEPSLQMTTCNQSKAVRISDHNDEDCSPELSSTKEMHNLVIKNRESEGEHIQDKPLSTGAESQEMLQLSDSVCSAQLTKCDPSNSTLTKEPILLSSQEENCNQALMTPCDQSESPSENKTQVSKPINQTYLNLHGNHGRNGRKKRRQRNLDHYFPSLKKLKKCRPPLASEPDHTSEPLHSSSEDKTVELALFGAGHQESSSTTEKGKCLDSSHISMSYEKHRPPGVLSVKLASSGRSITTANPTKDYSVKQLLYEKWKRSIPTMIGSVPFRHKRKLRRQASLPVLMSSGSTQEKRQTISPELRNSISKKYTLNIKKNKALYEHHRCKEIQKRSYSVSIEQPEHWHGGEAEKETSDGKQVHDGIVLKFSILPNTFNFTDGSSEIKKAAEPVSDKLEPIKKRKFSDETPVKPKGTWYPSEAKLYEPLLSSKNVGLFHEYQKKYKEKTRTLSVE